MSLISKCRSAELVTFAHERANEARFSTVRAADRRDAAAYERWDWQLISETQAGALITLQFNEQPSSSRE